MFLYYWLFVVFIIFIDNVGLILSYFIIVIVLFVGNYDDLFVIEFGG